MLYSGFLFLVWSQAGGWCCFEREIWTCEDRKTWYVKRQILSICLCILTTLNSIQTLQRWTVAWLTKWRIWCGRKRSWANRDIISALPWRGGDWESHENTTRISGDPAEIRTEHLLNRSRERYLLTALVDENIKRVKVKVKLSLYRPWWPLGLWEVEAPTVYRQEPG
jgi:hypothetical protein